MIFVYNSLVIFCLIAAGPVLVPYLLISEKRRRSFIKRLGFQSFRLQAGAEGEPALDNRRPVWIHALSVGEMLATLPLIHQLRSHQPDLPIVFSASTVSGYENAKKTLFDLVDDIVYFPHDLQFAVHRVVTRINPGAVVIMESDIWPNFVSKMKSLGIPVIFANAKVSDRSFKTFCRFPWLARLLFSKFAKICAQTEEDVRRFKAIGVPGNAIVKTGNIKFDQEYETLSERDMAELKQSIASNPGQRIWVAGSTHDGEEAFICKALKKIKNEFSGLLLIVAPRDPKRAKGVKQLFVQAGFDARCLSEQRDNLFSVNKTDVLVIDCIGLLRRFYAIADIALVGGSLLCIRGIGGHNPLEPAAYSKPVIFGPNMTNFKEISRAFTETGGCVQVETEEDLGRAVTFMLSDRQRASHIGQKAFQVFCANKGAVEKTLTVLQQYIYPPAKAFEN
jgi:3-deoxy-D-manno-octulosonic-acid transferase